MSLKILMVEMVTVHQDQIHQVQINFLMVVVTLIHLNKRVTEHLMGKNHTVHQMNMNSINIV